MCVSIYNICVFMCVDTHSHTGMLLKTKNKCNPNTHESQKGSKDHSIRQGKYLREITFCD